MKSFIVITVGSFVLFALILFTGHLSKSQKQDTKSIEIPVAGSEIDLRAKKDNATFNPQEIKLKKNLDLYRKFMEKCFLKFYERQKGQVENAEFLVHFFTTKSGQLTEIKFVQDPYQDKSLTQCLKEVLTRVRLKQKDQVIKVIFPIEVSWP